jgi:PPOX class probable F420-dependent enzyme
MIGAMAADQPVLSAAQRAFLEAARLAVLVTIAPDGRPRPVPICFVIDPERPVLWTPIDDKPKRSNDPLALARVRDIAVDPRVTVLADRWDEDWARLAWLRCEGRATLARPAAADHVRVVVALRAKYQQYLEHRLETRPLIRIDLERSTSWGLAGRP